MKLKPIYIYSGVIVLAIIFLVFFTTTDNSNVPESIQSNQMPNDDIHKGLQQPPGKSNVSSEVKRHLEVLKKAVEKNPKDTLKMREYADFLAAAHQPDEAVTYYNNILKVNPKRSDILFSLAYIYFNKKDYNKAEDLVNKILLYEPDNTEAIYNLGAIAASNGDKVKARTQWEKLIRDYPGSKASKLAESSLKKL
jgi:cytochrome c-type biogenesis protein CcmH/NrfG